MHDRLKERGQEIADEIEAIWKNADDEDRGLSRRERGRVETLIEKAKSLKEQRRVDAEIREVLGGGEQRVTRMDPNATVGEGWSEVAEAIAAGHGRPQTPRAQRRQPWGCLSSGCSLPRCTRRELTLGPSAPSSAGSSVSAAVTATSTDTAAV